MLQGIIVLSTMNCTGGASRREQSQKKKKKHSKYPTESVHDSILNNNRGKRTLQQH
jgi:hypothetical protein